MITIFCPKLFRYASLIFVFIIFEQGAALSSLHYPTLSCHGEKMKNTQTQFLDTN